MSTEVFNEEICLHPAEAKLRAILYDLGAIQKEHYAENGDMVLTLRMQRQDFKRALARADVAESRFLEPIQEAWH